MKIDGIAHVLVTVSDLARARELYGELLPLPGLEPVLDGEGFHECVGGRTAFGIRLERSFVPGRGLLPE